MDEIRKLALLISGQGRAREGGSWPGTLLCAEVYTVYAYYSPVTFHLSGSCMPAELVWFRRDLRLQDNLALAAACRDTSARVPGTISAPPSGRPMIWRRGEHGIHQRTAQCATGHGPLQRDSRCCFASGGFLTPVLRRLKRLSAA